MNQANIIKAKVKSMMSSRGNPVANQFIIEMEGNKVGFQSYETLICVWDRKEQTLFLNQNWWDYSNTTRKYFKEFITMCTSLDYINRSSFNNIIERHSKIQVESF